MQDRTPFRSFGIKTSPEAIMAILSHTSVATLMVLTNKALVSSFNVHFEWGLLFAQNLMTPLIALFFRQYGYCPPFELTWKTWCKFIPIAVLQISYLATSLITLRHLSVPIYTIVKSTAPVFMAVADAIVFNHPLTTKMLMALISVSIGTIMGYTEGWSTVLGILWLVLHIGFNVGHLVVQHSFKGYAKWESCFYNSAVTTPISLFASFYFREHIALAESWDKLSNNFSFWIVFFTSVVLGSVIMYTSYWLNHATSATTYSVVGSVSKVPMVAFSLLFFSNQPNNFWMWFGLGVVVVGTVWYGHAKEAGRHQQVAEDPETPGGVLLIEKPKYQRTVQAACVIGLIGLLGIIVAKSTQLPPQMNACNRLDMAWGKSIPTTVVMMDGSAKHSWANQIQTLDHSLLSCYKYKGKVLGNTKRMTKEYCDEIKQKSTAPVECEAVPPSLAAKNASHATDLDTHSRWLRSGLQTESSVNATKTAKGDEWRIFLAPGAHIHREVMFDPVLHATNKGCSYFWSGPKEKVKLAGLDSIISRALGEKFTEPFYEELLAKFHDHKMKIPIPVIMGLNNDALKGLAPLVENITDAIENSTLAVDPPEYSWAVAHAIALAISLPEYAVCNFNGFIPLKMKHHTDSARGQLSIHERHCLNDKLTVSTSPADDPLALRLHDAWETHCPWVPGNEVPREVKEMTTFEMLKVTGDMGALMFFAFIVGGLVAYYIVRWIHHSQQHQAHGGHGNL